eukprot:scaffold2639_cov385-Prasinococcus_capsulatus_cf.AAC.9
MQHGRRALCGSPGAGRGSQPWHRGRGPHARRAAAILPRTCCPLGHGADERSAARRRRAQCRAALDYWTAPWRPACTRGGLRERTDGCVAAGALDAAPALHPSIHASILVLARQLAGGKRSCTGRAV